MVYGGFTQNDRRLDTITPANHQLETIMDDHNEVSNNHSIKLDYTGLIENETS